MAETRLGRQTPTVSSVLPYTDSKGLEAVQLYNSSGRTAQDWQSLLLEDIMAVNDDGLWVHMKFGWSVPRRNGKSEILIIRAMFGLVHGERILYTAHRTTTSHNAWEKIIERLVKAGYAEGEDFKTMKRYGLETIEWLNGEGVIHFRTRSSKGGLGEGFDLLILDEAQEYTGDQESALKYVVTDSKNPQTLMCGTPPTAVSSGTVFLTYRRDILTGKSENAGWAEWSVPRLTDAHNPELWYETNPSLGTILTERTIRSELGNDQTDDNIQRLGLWLTYSQKSAISEREWMQFKAESPPKLKESVKLFFGVKFAKTSGNVSLAVAVRTADKKILIEALDCRPVRDGLDWIISFLRNPHTEKVIIDGAAGAPLLVQAMKDAEVKCRAILPKVSDVIEANALFEQNLFAGEILHTAQPSLVQAATNCEHRAIGAGGGFGYTSILENADVSLLEAVTLAHWACANAKEKKKQIITY
ncbi:MAG: terminase [Oscillospiraceae bacterium]|nr:terminase [Oscillospiraceae bacterium]